MHAKIDFVECLGLTIGGPGGVLLPPKMAVLVCLEQAPKAEEYAYCDGKAPIRKRGWPVILVCGFILFVYLN
jgi:hypothetical protein